MLPLAYLILAAAVAWAVATRSNPWLRRRSPRARDAVRTAAAALAALLAAGAVTVVTLAADGEVGWVAVLVGAAAGAGGVVYLAGIVLWTGGAAFALRVAGFALLALAGAVPSTLTLGLVLVAPLAVTLVPVGAVGAAHASRPRSVEG